jgi:hypothetical protein
MGQVFFNRPDAINWNHKCKNFKGKEKAHVIPDKGEASDGAND